MVLTNLFFGLNLAVPAAVHLPVNVYSQLYGQTNTPRSAHGEQSGAVIVAETAQRAQTFTLSVSDCTASRVADQCLSQYLLCLAV